MISQAISLVSIAAWLAVGPAPDASSGLQVHVRPGSNQFSPNHPVWVQFVIENQTNEPVTLTVPGAEPAIPPPEMGLPLSHVFSGGGSAAGVSVATEGGRHWDQAVGFRSAKEAPILLLGAKSTVGATFDLREYFPSLRSPGQYRVTWKPYGGTFTSESALINIAPRKQVEIVTDDGTMTFSLFYDEAPQHVANFLELVRTGFYTGKSFHRLEPGYLIQGGCPRGDGSGIRLDGKRVPAEFNSRVHEKGSVSMALLDDDADSGSCQFFVCNTRQKDWDGRYTVFAQLIGEASFQTLDRLMAVPVDDQGRPQRTLYFRSVRLTDAPADANP